MILQKAKVLATRDLRACFTSAGIIAGPHHFIDLWARDSFFASLGILKKSDYAVVRKTIETFLAFQRHDGLIPYRVMRSYSTIGKYFGKPKLRSRLTANFYSHMSLGLVPDGGLMAVIASTTYAIRSGDVKWVSRVFPSLVRSMDWYVHRFKQGLISEWYQCEWADGVLKSGKTLYTNTLYVKAVADMEKLSGIVGNHAAAQRYRSQFISLKQKFHDTFWNGTYFSDWIDWKRQNYFASHANFLAIIFGLTEKEESRSILAYAQTHSMNTFTLHNTYPAYPVWRIPFVQMAAGVPDYHNRGVLWLQPGITYALALYYSNQKKPAREWFTQIAQHLVKHNGVFEVYESQSGLPLRRFMYTSEGPFAWSAGLFLWAFDILF